MMDWDDRHMSAGWGVTMMLMMLAVWLLTVVAVTWFVRSSWNPRHEVPTRPGDAPSVPDAEQVLAQRLARGEIELDDYQARVTALKASR